MSSIAARPMPVELPRAAASNFWMGMTDFLLMFMGVWLAIPEGFTDGLRFASVPMSFVLFYGACLSMAASCLMYGRRWNNLLCLVTFAFFGYMTFLGVTTGVLMHFCVIDASIFLGIPVGIIWYNQRGPVNVIRLFRWWLAARIVLLMFSFAAARLGIVQNVTMGDRVFTYSMFGTVASLFFLSPLVFTTSDVGTTSVTSTMIRKMVLGGMFVALIVGLSSATRSIFLVWTACLMVIFWLNLSGRLLALGLFVASLFAAAVMVNDASVSVSDDAALFRRLGHTNIAEEERFTEIQMMFEEFDTEFEYYLGRGFGSRFRSTVLEHLGEPMAHQAHISIFTFWLKGGLLTFLIFVVGPAILGLTTLLKRKWNSPRTHIQATACGCFLLVLMQASMSGGWDFQTLIIYGALFMMAHDKYFWQRPSGPLVCRNRTAAGRAAA